MECRRVRRTERARRGGGYSDRGKWKGQSEGGGDEKEKENRTDGGGEDRGGKREEENGPSQMEHLFRKLSGETNRAVCSWN